jgi:hypothetical protein
MARSALLSSTSFAHLLGISRAETATAGEDDGEIKRKPGESDEDFEKRKKEAKSLIIPPKPRASSDGPDGPDGDDTEKRDDETDDEYKARKAKKSKAIKAGGDDDSDESDEASAEFAPIRRRERARCAAIFASPAAAKRPDVAAHLAFGTNLTRTAAIDTLAAVAMGERPAVVKVIQPAAANDEENLRSRMAAQPVYEIGTEQERQPVTGPKAFAAAVLVADKKRRGEA